MMADPAAPSSTTTDPGTLTGDPATTTAFPTGLSGLGSTTITLASTTITLGGTPVSLSPQQSSEVAQADGGGNETDYLNSMGSCLMPNAVPIVIQNLTSWNEVGCLPGFYCESLI